MGMRRIYGFPPVLLILLVLLVLLPTKAHAFGAGNIASISAVEGKNWRHGDIEDTIKALAFIKGHKWTSAMIKRVYFGNWLRDYSQAMDVGTLKNLPADTIRILVWILSFMSFGYATAEYEVTSERLGVYRPEEHIDNPKDYADNQDARQYDPRLRPPVRQIELEIDPHTGMKNYIANERGDWATSAAYVRYSLSRSIHYGRMYTSGHRRGQEEDLWEALRCLGQGLHTLEDFAAHTNYIELALREMGFHNVFPHTGRATQMNIRGRNVFPLVTGTFGVVDFLHSVLGEATDHFTQSEINEMDITLGNAQSNSSSNPLNALTGLLGNIPGTSNLVTEAEALQRRAEEQEHVNRARHMHTGYASSSRGFDGDSSRGFEHERSRGYYEQSRVSASTAPPPATGGGASGPGLPGLPDFDPQQTIDQIYPILEFRDKVVRTVSSIIEKIPGLEDLVDKITEAVTVYVFSLLAPFIRPIINAASQALQTGSAGVIDASGKHQYEPWTDPTCTDPTHSLLSKDHFSNVLNEPAGHVAAAILRYVVPRVLYAWQHIDIPVERVMDDCVQVFHHPALRDLNNEAHRTMFEAVQNWVNSRPDRGADLNDILSAEGVREGRNLTKDSDGQHSHGPTSVDYGYGYGASHQQYQQPQNQSSSTTTPAGVASALDELGKLPIPGISELSKLTSSLLTIKDDDEQQQQQQQQYQPPPYPPPSGDSYSYGGGYSHHHAPQQPQYDSGFNIPPSSGYDRYYHQTSRPEEGWRGSESEYRPPENGSHSYDYYSQQQPQHQSQHTRSHSRGSSTGHSRSSSHDHSHEHRHSHKHRHSHSRSHSHDSDHDHDHGHSHHHRHAHERSRHEYKYEQDYDRDQTGYGGGYGGYYD